MIMKYLSLLLLLAGCAGKPEDNGRIISKHPRVSDNAFCRFWYQRYENDDEDFIDSCAKYEIGDYITNATPPSQ